MVVNVTPDGAMGMTWVSEVVWPWWGHLLLVPTCCWVVQRMGVHRYIQPLWPARTWLHL